MPTTANLSLTYVTPFDPAYVDLWGTPLNTAIVAFDAELAVKTINQSFADKILSRAKFKDESEVMVNLGSTLSGALAVDYANGHYQYGTLTGNITSITISNQPPAGTSGYLTLELTQDGTGGRTTALTGYYEGNSVTMTTSASAKNLLYFHRMADGTNWVVSCNPNITVI